MELDTRSVTSEPASPFKSPGEEKMEVTSELSSSDWQSRDSGFFERGIKTMLSIRKSRRSLKKEKGKEESAPWKSPCQASCYQPVSNLMPALSQPLPPVSAVMEINELIQKRQLLQAFASIKLMEDETISEWDSEKYRDNPQELVRKSKDVDLLYNSITNAIKSIVEETLEDPNLQHTMLTSMVTLIALEEAAHSSTDSAARPGSDLLGRPRKWREQWREAVNESARKRVLKAPMASREEETSWLHFHLHFLQEHLKEDLLKIKSSVKKCYPEEYQVCDTYVGAFHNAIASHLQELSQGPLDFHELYTLLNWVIIGEHVKSSGAISGGLETKMLELCMAELLEFIPRSSLPTLVKKQGGGPGTGTEQVQGCLLLFNQDLLHEVHKYVVKEYVTQIIKPRWKMNKDTRQQVSRKMSQEAAIIHNGSKADWLLPAISHIANIIGEKKKDKIKAYVKELCQDYPDIRYEHILAILALRVLGRTRRAAILRQVCQAQESSNGGKGGALFAEIDVPVICSCF
uniref:Exocyst complex component 3-like protein 4 n=1 Tax=Junco hyemalis TaxID=40217 RepID=A0A8C5J8H1_JUNHY